MNSERTFEPTFLFTDIEGSTRLWEQDAGRMKVALERHDALARSVVGAHRGRIVKMSGDGIHAAFYDAADALAAAVALQRGLLSEAQSHGAPLEVRCGIHVGPAEPRDGDFFGPNVNRAARIMAAAHGGQVLVSAAVAERVAERLPAGSELLDLGQVRLRDLSASEHVYQLCHPALRRTFPPLRSLESTPNNLPQMLSSFVGRQRESEEIEQQLARVRLLTLHGAGGLGKTRLALHVADRVLDAFPDGVWLVELAAVGEPALVAGIVAAALRVRDDPTRSPADALAAHVADRTLLVILDNCEHLVAACARIARQLLAAGPNVRVLATSREPLHVAGEHAYPVLPLAVPDAARVSDPAALGEHDAVRLFCERARAVQPAFALTPANASGVADICRRLDGIALAIELAAARTRTLSTDAIGRGLDDRFRLLTHGDASALPRQQTLRALIDWSFDLLDADERTLFRRLAVFAGSMARESALAVCGAAPLDVGTVDDALSRLVEKSLVVFEAEAGRYRMLETVRQYALERLGEAGEKAALRERHLEHFVAIAERERPRLTGPEQGAAMQTLDAELENFLAAHAFCDRAVRGAEFDLRLAYALKLYFVNRGLPHFGYALAVEALARPGAQERNLARCRGLTDAGLLGFVIGEYDAVARYLEESLTIARELADPRRIAGALQPLGMTYLALGDMPRARACLVEAVERARDLGDARELAAANNALAQFHRVEGTPARAAPLYDRVVALARQLDDRESIAIGLLNLAMVSIELGELAAIPAMLREVIGIAAETGSKVTTQCALDVCAGLAAARGDAAAAARFLEHGEALSREMGIRRDPADAAFIGATIARVRALGATLPPDHHKPDPIPWRARLAVAGEWLDSAPA